MLVVCLTLFGQSFALASVEETHHAQDHCCLLCHAGPLPFLQTTISAIAAPVFAVVWMAPERELDPAPAVLLSTFSSRGPPLS
jgi:hypothetical protein